MSTFSDALGQPARDGRALRSERNRNAILDAFYTLLAEGVLFPRASQVAERTGIAVRTVYRHFSEIDSLFDELNARLHHDIRDLLTLEPPSGTLEQRVKALVVAHCELFERTAPFVRSRDYNLHRHEWLVKERERSDAVLEHRVHTWVPEIAAAPPAVRDAIEAVLSFDYWNRLRARPGSGPVRTAAAVELAALSLIAQLQG